MNHIGTENDVKRERQILKSIGGGCLYPAGIKVKGDVVSVQISPKNWREFSPRALIFLSRHIVGHQVDMSQTTEFVIDEEEIIEGAGISTLNSNRLATVLQNNGISVINKPVIDLVAKPENWPHSFIDDSQPRSTDGHILF